MNLNKIILLFSLLLPLYGCDERAVLNVKSGGASGGETSSEETIWRSECNGSNREYIHISRIGFRFLMLDFDRPGRCESEDRGLMLDDSFYFTRQSESSNGWKILIGNGFYGNSGRIIYQIQGNLLILLHSPDSYIGEDGELFRIEDVDESDMTTFEFRDELPDLEFNPPPS